MKLSGKVNNFGVRIIRIGFTVAVWIGAMCPASNAGNIFDDDWIPPARSRVQPIERPKSQPPQTAPTQSPLPGPGHVVLPPTLPGDNPVGAPPINGKRPVPTPAQQAKSRLLFKELYATQLSDRSVAARETLAELLSGDVAKVRENPTDKFVLLVATIEAAKEAGALALCFHAADEMAREYDVDALSVKADAASGISAKALTEADSRQNVLLGLDLVEQLIGAEDFSRATRVCRWAQGISTRDVELRSQIAARTNEIAAAKSSREKVEPFLQKLASSPNDSASNQAVGEYVCFTKGDWNSGLLLLSKGSDPELATLARADIAASGANARAAVADGWWKLAEKPSQTAWRKAKMLAHAANLYGQALPQLPDGLQKMIAQKRVEVIATAPNSAISLARESGGWTVIFRSSDPSIWNSDTNKGHDSFSMRLDKVPADVQYLRLAVPTGQCLIIPMTSEQLGKDFATGRHGWNGDNRFDCKAYHLGIFSRVLPRPRGGVDIGPGGVAGSGIGWGFGNHKDTDDTQGYGWAGKEVGITVFEISVKTTPLTRSEKGNLVE